MNAAIFLNAVQQIAGMNVLVDRLFWASFEMAILASVVWMAFRLFRGLSPRARALLWLLVLVKPIVALAFGAPVPIFRVSMEQPAPSQETPVIMTQAAKHTDSRPSPGSQSAGKTSSSTRASSAVPVQRIQQVSLPAGTENVAPLPPAASTSTAQKIAGIARRAWADLPGSLMMVWSGALFLLLLHKGTDYIRLYRIVRHGEAPAPVLKERYRVFAGRLGVKRAPRLLVTNALESPVLAGVINPVVLLPAWMKDETHEAALGWALCHELIHWKHGDTFANLLRQLAQTLFFFHPLVRWAGRHWEEAAELACDRALVNSQDEANEYARSLFDVLTNLNGQKQQALAGGLFATRTQVGKRIAALLANPFRYPARLGIGLMLALALISGATLAFGGAFSVKERMVPVGGILVDESDVPVEGAHVRLFYNDEDTCSHSLDTVSDASGRWHVEIPEGITQVSWSVQHPEFAANHDTGWITISDVHKSGTFRYVLPRGMQAGGTVSDAAGKPIPGALVIWGTMSIDDFDAFRSKLAENKDMTAIVTDDQGHYSIMVNPKAFYRRSLSVFAEGYAPQAFLINESVNTYDVTLDEGVAFTGTVQDAFGNPMTGVGVAGYSWIHYLTRNDLLQMWVEYMKTETDESGRFSIPHIPTSGTITFFINKDGFYGKHVDWSAAEVSMENIYRLYPKEPIRGRIVNAETGAPVKRFEIRSGTPYDWKFFSASDGAFELDYASEVQVRAKGYCFTTQKVPPIQERSDFFLEIALKPGKALSGRVLSADNRPASKADIAILLPDEEVLIEGATINKRIAAVPRITTTTDARGRFQMETYDTPGLLLIVHVSGWLVQPLANYDPGKSLVLTPWSRIEGTATLDYHSQGNEANRMWAKPVQPDPWNYGESLQFRLQADIDDTGNYAIDYVPAVPLQIGQGRRHVMSHAQRVDPIPGQTVQANLYRANTGAVQGRLSLDAIEQEPEGPGTVWNTSDKMLISARQKDANQEDKYAHFVPYVQPDGFFTLRGLPAGEYVLTATLHGPVSSQIGSRGLTLGKWACEFSITLVQEAPLDLGTLTYEITPPPQTGQTAPDIEGTTSEGESWRLSHERGKPVLVILWASCDSPSRARIPALRELFQRYGGDEKLRIIGVILDYSADSARDFLADNPVPWAHQQTFAVRNDDTITRTYGGDNLPLCWLVDADGVIIEGNIPVDELDDLIEKDMK